MPLPRKSLAKRKTIGGHVLTRVLPIIEPSDRALRPCASASTTTTQSASKSASLSELVDADGFQFIRKKPKTSHESSHLSPPRLAPLPAVSFATVVMPLNDTQAVESSKAPRRQPQGQKSLAAKMINFEDMAPAPDRRSIAAGTTALKRLASYGSGSSLVRRRSSVALRSCRPSILPAVALAQDLAALPETDQASGSALSLAAPVPVGMPHSSIPTADYYKYLAAELPGPLRLKQLLLWGFHAIVLAQGDGPAASMPDLEEAAARQALQETFDALQANEFSVSWYQRDCASEPSRRLKPHPKDKEARALICHYESVAARIDKEVSEWEALLTSVKSCGDDDAAALSGECPAAGPTCERERDALAASILDTEHELVSWNRGLLEIDSWMQSFEFKVDQLQNALKMSANLERHARSICESTFHQIVQHVFTRRENALPPMDPLIVLRSLSRTSQVDA